MANALLMASQRFLARKRRCRLPAFWNRQFSTSHLRSATHEINEPIEEELFPSNRLRCFHPTHPGEILNGRFKTISKLGFGACSTVWLAENLKFKKQKESLIPRFVSIKIATLDSNASWEASLSKMINAQRPHDGLDFIRTPIDEFHAVSSIQARDRRTSNDPTANENPPDIKGENIMITFENDTLLADYANYQTSVPQWRHIRSEDGRVTYFSQDEFGPLEGNNLLPQLADFNACFPGLVVGRGHLFPIQSDRYRAPEVLLGCGWSYSADIWNFGLLMWNLLEDINLFGGSAGEGGEYDAHVRLSWMVSLLGEPPEEVIQRERFSRTHHLERPVMNLCGKECKTMNQYWGGPFFDDEGQILRKDLLREGMKLADTVTELAGDEKEMFLDFASGMLQWLPEKRKTAKELLEHPLLEEIHKSYLEDQSGSIES
ncbi:unnamed protein product [Clonostachys byssicola]|uniref:non-specific serine/threonine protein kinase n=1 Tax=Clonostachys byssicola TaxID=160290 RepID=A0A9N9XXR2_9HYPO|nr:unnamed protein product [Clonostachys byssicola]